MMGVSDLNICGMHVFRIRNYCINVCVFHKTINSAKNGAFSQKCGGALKYLLQSFQINAKSLTSRTSLKVRGRP